MYNNAIMILLWYTFIVEICLSSKLMVRSSQDVATEALRCRWGCKNIQNNKRAKHMVFSAYYASQHHTSSLQVVCAHTLTQTLTHWGSARFICHVAPWVHHVLSSWTLILALCIAHNCSLLVHKFICMPRWNTLRPVQLQKVTRAACSGHT